MHKSIASNAFTITIIIILFCSILIAWIKSEYEKEGKFFNPVCIQVQSGQTIVSVSNMLEEENLIHYNNSKADAEALADSINLKNADTAFIVQGDLDKANEVDNIISKVD